VLEIRILNPINSTLWSAGAERSGDPRFCFFHPRSHAPNGSSNPNRSTVLPLPEGEGCGEGKGASNCIVIA
jgi:hypothetical protein